MNNLEAITIEVAHSNGAQHTAMNGLVLIDSPHDDGYDVRLELRGADGVFVECCREGALACSALLVGMTDDMVAGVVVSILIGE